MHLTDHWQYNIALIKQVCIYIYLLWFGCMRSTNLLQEPGNSMFFFVNEARKKILYVLYGNHLLDGL